MYFTRLGNAISIDKVLPYIKPEAEKVWEYYKTELLRSIQYIADMSGTVMMLEAESLDAVRAAINELPMVQNEILDIEIFSLKPYTGIEKLFDK